MFAEIGKLPYLSNDQICEELESSNVTKNSVTHKLSKLHEEGKIIKPHNAKHGDGKWKIEPHLFESLKTTYIRKLRWKNRIKHEPCYCTHLKKTETGRTYCSITNHIIDRPINTCDIMCATVTNDDGIPEFISFPICESYWDGEVNAISQRISKEKFKKLEAEYIGLKRYQSHNVLDPESKHYLPNLVLYNDTQQSLYTPQN